MSDRELQALRRLYRETPGDVNLARNYISALERSMGSTSDARPSVFNCPVERQLTLGLAENGIIANLSQLGRITTIAQLETLVYYLFPFGGVEDFVSTDSLDGDRTAESPDWIRVRTGIWAYRDPHSSLAAFFRGYGYLEHLSKGDEVVWCAPFKTASWGWWETADSSNAQVWREAWRNQGLVYWQPTGDSP